MDVLPGRFFSCQNHLPDPVATGPVPAVWATVAASRAVARQSLDCSSPLVGIPFTSYYALGDAVLRRDLYAPDTSLDLESFVVQDGFYWACACVPSGRISADDYISIADIADK